MNALYIALAVIGVFTLVNISYQLIVTNQVLNKIADELHKLNTK